MFRTIRWSVVVLLTIFGVCALSWVKWANENPTPVGNVPGSTQVSAKPIYYKTAWDWQHGAHAHYVIRTEDEWRRMRRRARPPWSPNDPPPAPIPPPVDFSKEMILAVFQGSRGSTGYGVKIIDVSETEEQLTVVVKYRELGPGEGAAAIMTYPFSMVSVPRSDKAVGFRIVEVSGPW